MRIKCLFTKEQISRRVVSLASEISHDYSSSKEIIVLCVLNGSIFFAADLLRELRIPCQLSCIKAASDSNGEIVISGTDVDVSGRDVLILEDIVDSGITLKALFEKYNSMNPKSIKVCTFLDKKARRIEDIKADYSGFDIEDKFVVGYGMDYNGKYRELPYIGYIIY